MSVPIQLTKDTLANMKWLLNITKEHSPKREFEKGIFLKGEEGTVYFKVMTGTWYLKLKVGHYEGADFETFFPRATIAKIVSLTPKDCAGMLELKVYGTGIKYQNETLPSWSDEEHPTEKFYTRLLETQGHIDGADFEMPLQRFFDTVAGLKAKNRKVWIRQHKDYQFKLPLDQMTYIVKTLQAYGIGDKVKLVFYDNRGYGKLAKTEKERERIENDAFFTILSVGTSEALLLCQKGMEEKTERYKRQKGLDKRVK